MITCCPKCKGTSGFVYELWVQNFMVGLWGAEAEAGDSCLNRSSLAKCLNCGAKFNYRTAEGKTKKDDLP